MQRNGGGSVSSQFPRPSVSPFSGGVTSLTREKRRGGIVVFAVFRLYGGEMVDVRSFACQAEVEKETAF